jgi:hypothetical protein
MKPDSSFLCDVGGCTHEAAAGAPISLCVDHLALAADWVGQEFGVEDALPSPCPACGSRLGVRYPSGWLCAVCEWVYGTSPDEDLPRPRVEVVYYIRFEDRMKIGTSSNLRQRMARLWHEELVAIERGGRDRERARHEQFAAYRLGTSEWFELAPELLVHAETLSAGVEDPWVLYARWVSEDIAARA